MNTSASRPVRLVLICGLLAFTSARAGAEPTQIWSGALGEDARWEKVTPLGTLLVGTDAAIQSFDPQTGKLLWKNTEFKKSNQHNTRDIAGTPFLVCSRSEGLGGTKTTLSVLDYLTGEPVWSTPQLTARYLGTIPVPSQNLVIFVLDAYATTKGEESGTMLFAHNLGTGERVWSLKLGKNGAIPLHLADNSGSFIPTMDLSGYHDPVIDGDEMYLGYLGVHCVDLKTGALKWAVTFPPGNAGLKKTYAPLRIVGDRIYGAGGGSVYAINRLTGETLWKSDRISSYAGLLKARNNAIISQLEIVGDKIFARYGGNFSNGKQVFLTEPLGLVVVSATDGHPLYQAKDIEAGLTNLLVLADGKTVMFADGKDLVGLDASAETPVETFRVPIEFKRKMGGADMAKIGLGITGGLMGIAKAAVSQSKARLDVPVAVTQQNGFIVVRGKQHLLGFDPETKTEKWSLYYAAPSEAFANVAMFAVTAAASFVGNAQVAQNGGILNSGGQQGMENIQSALDRYNRYTEKQAAKGESKGSEAYAYILTKLEKSKAVGIVGVNLETGDTERELPLGSKEPQYLADEAAGRIYYFKGGDKIEAYQF